jgi:hypothetical protein
VNSQRVLLTRNAKACGVGNYPTVTPLSHSDKRYALGHNEEDPWFYSRTITFLASNLLRVDKPTLLEGFIMFDASYMEDVAGNNPMKCYPSVFKTDAYKVLWVDHFEKNLKLAKLISISPSETPKVYVLGADSRSLIEAVDLDLALLYADHPQCLMPSKKGCYLKRAVSKEAADTHDDQTDVTYGELSSAISGLTFKNLHKARKKRNKVGFNPSGSAAGLIMCHAKVEEVQGKVLLGNANAEDLCEAQADLSAQQFSFDSNSRGGE